MIEIERYHDICCGHRVHEHEGKCKNLHGHNYRFFFTLESRDKLDKVGRVLDFSVIKEKLCNWLETEWDHRFLIWKKDPLRFKLQEIDDTIVIVDFNPTAENIALNFLHNIAPKLLSGTGAILRRCRVEETRKCSATAILDEYTDNAYYEGKKIEDEYIQDDLPF
jgi:6-pyruvoyltetrahydropterin/6-carboxytetrahydropterin synthase